MKFRFKIQQYQTDAVENTVSVFAGQTSLNGLQKYRRDIGNKKKDLFSDQEDETAYRNHDVTLDKVQLLENIRRVQRTCDIKESASLITNNLGACNLDIEMETGTGKTYVYIKTMFELNKRYGWSKFIVVVPSIAIREGVAKSFATLEEHFMEHYGKKARYFVYNSGNLHQLDSYSTDGGINVMIINTQAFASSFNEDKNVEGRGGDAGARIIYTKRDNFQSRRPIDVISANRPIIIMDEPQKMEGAATQKGLKSFNPLFVLNYSATHKTQHNTVYALDALDAFKQKLVKKIQVKGFSIQNLRGSNGYMYLDSIVLSKKEAPAVRMEIDVKSASGTIQRRLVKLNQYDSLYTASNNLAEYKGFVISDIDVARARVVFQNDAVIRKGEVIGDTSEKTIQRLQIRETIRSHFQKEAALFNNGIKCLSLFFIDEVANYKSYNENGEEVHEFLWKTFEEEYVNVLNEQALMFEPEYKKFLDKTDPCEVHRGYFSIDKKGHSCNSTLKRGDTISDDISAYELILKNKERLLSNDEPCRFIFSHSALREGWDNPNVFQICTLRHANSTTAKRQEVGRGLRLCVDQNGNRMDLETLGDDQMHVINKLTVIANESYNDFVSGLQAETREVLRERPTKANDAFFRGKTIMVNGEKHVITPEEASMIFGYLLMNDYVDGAGTVSDEYRTAAADDELEALPKKLRGLEEGIHTLIQSLYDESKVMDDMVEDGNETETYSNDLNKNFDRTEFQALWKELNHQYAYTVHYDSDELIKNCINAINENLNVTKLRYVVTTGEQTDVDQFDNGKSTQQEDKIASTSNVPYDLVGDIARGATLTRRTVVAILKGTSEKLWMFRHNPEEYIKNAIAIIKEQKATMIVEHIGYSLTEGKYDSNIFTQEKHKEFNKAYKADKHITDFVFTDGAAENSIERTFAEALDSANEVAVYAKLPRTFRIPTPVGNYSPDWAIAFQKGAVKHIFFVAETKGSMDSMQLRAVEKAKIHCAEVLFNQINRERSLVRYHKVASYKDLLDAMSNID